MHQGSFAGSLMIWGLAAYLLIRLLQYVLLARVYLTCAARALKFEIADPGEMSAADRQILESADLQLEQAGFRPLIVTKVVPLLTYYGAPEFVRVFVCERDPVVAVVSRRPTREQNSVVTIELETLLPNGRSLVTKDSMSADIASFSSLDEEVVPGASIVELLRRHSERLLLPAQGARPLVANDPRPRGAGAVSPSAADLGA